MRRARARDRCVALARAKTSVVIRTSRWIRSRGARARRGVRIGRAFDAETTRRREASREASREGERARRGDDERERRVWTTRR
jgi:hypothetical protein